MTWLLRLAALLVAFLLLSWLWRWFWRTGWKRLFHYTLDRMERPAAPPTRHGTVKRDPVCGTYVDVAVSVQEHAHGETLHFCSERCRDTYCARQPVEVRNVH